MALVIFPNEGWNSYLDLVEVENLYNEYIINRENWDILSDIQKELYIKQATLLIKNKINDIEVVDDNIKLALVYLINYSLDKDMTNSDGNENVKVLEIDGAIKKEYFTKNRKNNAFPDIVIDLLRDYGFRGNNSFSLERA